MLVEHNHFGCNPEPLCHRNMNKVRSFYCREHDIITGPAGWKFGHYGGHSSREEEALTIYSKKEKVYDPECSFNFICALVKSMFEIPRETAKFPAETEDNCYKRNQKRLREVRNLRLKLVSERWEPLVLYADLSKTDYSIIADLIIKYNT